MKPNLTIKPKQVVNLCQLKTFDRFCFITDKKKVWQVVQHVVVEDKIKGGNRNVTKCINDLNEAKRFDSNRSVMFLRSNNPDQCKPTRLKKNELIDY